MIGRQPKSAPGWIDAVVDFGVRCAIWVADIHPTGQVLHGARLIVSFGAGSLVQFGAGAEGVCPLKCLSE